MLLARRGPGYRYKGNFTFLCADALAPHGSPELKRAKRHLLGALRQLGNIITTGDRLDWMREQCGKDKLLASKWMFYAGMDIEYWHVQTRALLDHLAKVISRLAERSDQVPDSFTRLYMRVHHPESAVRAAEFAEKLGLDWLDLIRGGTWYAPLREAREALVHRGGYALVFGWPEDGILFQVHEGFVRKINVAAEPLMFNPNVVHFDRYAAVMLSNILLLLEDFATVTYGRLSTEPHFNGTYLHFGLATLMRWIDSTTAVASAQMEATGGPGAASRPPRAPTKGGLLEPPGGFPGLIIAPGGPDE